MHNCTHYTPHVYDREIMRFKDNTPSVQRRFDDDVLAPAGHYDISVSSVKIHCPKCGHTRRYGYDEVILDGFVYIPLDYSKSVIRIC